MLLDKEFKTKEWANYRVRGLWSEDILGYKFDTCYIHYTECNVEEAKIVVQNGEFVIDFADIVCAINFELVGEANVTVIGNLSGITINNNGSGSITTYRTRYLYYVNRRYHGSYIEPVSMYDFIKAKVNKWLSSLKN